MAGDAVFAVIGGLPQSTPLTDESSLAEANEPNLFYRDEVLRAARPLYRSESSKEDKAHHEASRSM